MRGREIAQLYKDDIQQDKNTGIWFFKIVSNEKRKQRTKNNNAKRSVPIHPQLIKLGFLSFVDEAKKNSMIFPELYDKDGNHYKKFGNNFNRKTTSGWKWKCGVKRDQTSFHSFRHNVINQLERIDIPTRIICFLVGHSYKGGLVANYIKPDDMKTLYNAVKSIKYPSIDWKKIEKRWG
jgi:integrase